MPMSIKAVGIDSPHGKNFMITRPEGMPHWVFLHTITPHLVYTASGMDEMRVNECILYTPRFPRFLYVPAGLDSCRNNWIYFLADEEEAWLKDLGIPFNEILALRQPSIVTALLSDIVYERLQMRPQHERMERIILEALLIQLARNVVAREHATDRNENMHFHGFKTLRHNLYMHPERDWSVQDMAKDMFISSNWFTMLYKEFFGTTPKRDLINARVQQAKIWLSTDCSIREAALRVGFQNEFYFSNVFRKMTGLTPSEYRSAHWRGQ